MTSTPSATERCCTGCTLPESYPGVGLDEAALCNFCRRGPSPLHQEKRRAALRQRFERLVEEVRGTGSYDLLMAYSGGKDSTYALAHLRRAYGLEILALTVDNGFIPDTTIDNIRRVVDQLGVDHVILRPRLDLLGALFAEAERRDIFAPSTLGRASSICTACISVVKFACLRRAIEERIPMVGYGWSPGQAPLTAALRRPTAAMLRQMQDVLLEPIRQVIGRRAEGWFLRRHHFVDPAAIPSLVSPLALIGYDEAEIFAEIERLGWHRPEGVDANSTNCRLNALANRVHRERHGYHPYAFELAGLVRAGHLERGEALTRLREEEDPGAVLEARERLNGYRRSPVAAP
jgi:tRNA(Ile)-lysidine synthase TilS/MesJ